MRAGVHYVRRLTAVWYPNDLRIDSLSIIFIPKSPLCPSPPLIASRPHQQRQDPQCHRSPQAVEFGSVLLPAEVAGPGAIRPTQPGRGHMEENDRLNKAGT